jgi:sulfur carrier protein
MELSTSCLVDLLEAVHALMSGVAVAVNREIVSRSQWDSYNLSDGDIVEILTAAAGG